MKAKYEKDEICQTPSNEDAKIWRFMDFTKFVSLLEKRALFFCRADNLGDPFEGSFPKENIRLRMKKQKGDNVSLAWTSKAHWGIRLWFFINCWNLSEYESAAFWRLYVKGEEGIAVQSTLKRLAECFSPDAEESVRIGKISYLDYETQTLPETNILFPFLHKRRSFAHEQEVRAIIYLSEKYRREHSKPRTGIYVDVDLDVLIENVYVSPTTETWFEYLVKSVMERYMLRKKLIKSRLVEDPLY